MNSSDIKSEEKKLEQNEEVSRTEPKFNLDDVLEYDAENNLGADTFSNKVVVKGMEAEGLSVFYLLENPENKIQAWYPKFFVEQVYKKVN